MRWSLPINLNIAGTLRAWRSEIIGSNLLSKDEVVFKDFIPSLDFSTMAATAQVINIARYAVVGKVCLFSLDVQATLAATFTFQIVANLPVTAKGSTASFQGFSGVGQNAGSGEIILAQIGGTTNQLLIYRGNGTPNFTAGAWRARINGFIEID